MYASTAAAQLHYPETKTINQVDDYFGTKVSDPYRWLEDDTSADTKQWVKTEQQFTQNYLSQIPFRDKIKKRYQNVMNYPKYFGAFKIVNYIFYSQNTGLQNQSVYYYQEGLNGKPQVFIDPNTLSSDGSISLSLDAASNNKKYIAYHTNKGGSDWQKLYIMNIATHKKLIDEINWMKFGSAVWKGEGFYYSGYDKPAEGTELTAQNANQKVWYHKLSDTQDKDG
jgi:prolyl oligopeptidase